VYFAISTSPCARLNGSDGGIEVIRASDELDGGDMGRVGGVGA
jgi:hypothetical protein